MTLNRKVVTSNRADAGIDSMLEYLVRYFGPKEIAKAMQGFDEALAKLATDPHRGQPYPAFGHGMHTYILHRNRRLYYTFDDHTVYIWLVWDTRQSTRKLLRQLKNLRTVTERNL
jgi:plasmid stabilization system protein ParE